MLGLAVQIETAFTDVLVNIFGFFIPATHYKTKVTIGVHFIYTITIECPWLYIFEAVIL